MARAGARQTFVADYLAGLTGFFAGAIRVGFIAVIQWSAHDLGAGCA
jgi:hypothetical protein